MDDDFLAGQDRAALGKNFDGHPRLSSRVICHEWPPARPGEIRRDISIHGRQECRVSYIRRFDPVVRFRANTVGAGMPDDRPETVDSPQVIMAAIRYAELGRNCGAALPCRPARVVVRIDFVAFGNLDPTILARPDVLVNHGPLPHIRDRRRASFAWRTIGDPILPILLKDGNHRTLCIPIAGYALRVLDRGRSAWRVRCRGAAGCFGVDSILKNDGERIAAFGCVDAINCSGLGKPNLARQIAGGIAA